jgi:adenosylcobinamide-GDP ribazoletransferase
MENWLDDLRRAGAFLTRVPIPHTHDAAGFLRSMRVFPLVGAAIGLATGCLQLVLLKLALPPLAAAALTLGAAALVTGALHEDGLADVADGFGGGRNKDARLAIMRDSRLGTYGTLALLVSFAARAAALAALPAASVIAALVATHALARAVVPVLSLALPFARDDGLAAGAGQPDPLVVATALGLGALIAVICLPWGTAFAALLLTALGAAAMAWLAMRQIGGVTGDVLGATEQVGEVVILLVLAARFG